MKSRSELREKIMIILYQIDINRSQHINYNVEEIISSNLEIDNEFVRDIIYGVITYEDEIINIANKYMKNWDISRIDKTGAAILKMAIYELKYTDTPHIVVINEAVELAKKYSDDKMIKEWLYGYKIYNNFRFKSLYKS